jgi:hypothetical protein
MVMGGLALKPIGYLLLVIGIIGVIGTIVVGAGYWNGVKAGYHEEQREVKENGEEANKQRD